jgi:hypothetical protein
MYPQPGVRAKRLQVPIRLKLVAQAVAYKFRKFIPSSKAVLEVCSNTLQQIKP